MRSFVAVVAAVLAATLVPAGLSSGVWAALGGFEGLRFLPLALLVSAVVCLGHVLVLGVPAAGWLMKCNKFTWGRMLAVGAIAGFFPAAIWARPWQYLGTQVSISSGGVVKYHEGTPTAAAFLDYFQFAGSAAVLGAIGGLSFYLVYRGISPNNSFKPNPLRGSA